MQVQYKSLDCLPCPVYYTTEVANSLTTTSANHIANLAKQAYAEAETFLSSCSFLSKNLEVIGSGVQNELSIGMSIDDVKKLNETVHKVGMYKGLIAWLREAIKEKEGWVNSLKAYISVENWCKLQGKAYPSLIGVYADTIEYAMDKLSIKERATYLKNEAMAAAYGSFLHPSSPGYRAYNELLRRIRNPKESNLDGRDTIITSYVPTVSVDEVNEVMDQMRSEWRSYEAQVNSVKFAVQEADTNAENEARTKSDLNRRSILNEQDIIDREYETWVQNERKRIQTLRIVVPEMYTDLVAELNSLGKKK